MKIKYMFDRIRSDSDTIYIKTNDIVIKQYSKNDWGNNWEYLIKKPIYIKEEDCYDLTKLKTEGAEPHTVEFEDGLNDQWKPAAIKFLGTNHFNDELHLYAIKSFVEENPDDYITVIPQNNETFDTIHSTLVFISNQYKATFDLSNVTYIPSNTTINLTYSYISKLPKINYDDSTKYTLTAAASNIQEAYIDKHIVQLPSAFSGCKKFKKIAFDPNCEIENCSAMFGGSTIEELVIPPILRANSDIGNYYNMYLDCKNLKKVDLSGFPQRFYVKRNYSIAKGSGLPSQHFEYIEIQKNKNYNYLLGGTHTVGVVNIPYPEIPKVYKLLNPVSLTYTDMGQTKSTGDQNLIDNFVQIGFIFKNNYSYSISALFSNYPTSIAAIPFYGLHLMAGEQQQSNYFDDVSVPTSSGFEWWVDYTYERPFTCVKQITKKQTSITIPITTTLNSDIIEFSLPDDFIIPVENYPHDFKLDSIKKVRLDTISYAGDVKLTNFTYNEETKKFTVTASNIADDKIGTIRLNLWLFYKAIINGHDFHGTVGFPNLNINLSFTVDEDVDSSITLISDEEYDRDPTPCYNLEETIPVASSAYVGKTFTFLGESTDNFTKNAEYTCIDTANVYTFYSDANGQCKLDIPTIEISTSADIKLNLSGYKEYTEIQGTTTFKTGNPSNFIHTVTSDPIAINIDTPYWSEYDTIIIDPNNYSNGSFTVDVILNDVNPYKWVQVISE